MNQSSIETMYAKDFRTLRRFVRRTIQNPSDAQDIVQDAYLRLLTLPADYPSLESPRAFLFVVASRLAMDRLRRLRRSKRIFVSFSNAAAAEVGETDIASVACLASRPEDQADATMQFRLLLSSIAGLAPDCHRAFVMHKIQELSYAEVAGQMGISVSMVEKHLSKALRYLGLDRRSVTKKSPVTGARSAIPDE